MASVAWVRDTALRVAFGDGNHADFHFRWLRHNCDLDRHPSTRERVVDSCELPELLRVVSATTTESGSLRVLWEHDGRSSEYPMEWLRAHAYALNREDVAAPPSDLAAIEMSGIGIPLEECVSKALASLDSLGAVVVRRYGASDRPAQDETEEIIAGFAAGGLRVISTHFGYIEDLRTDNTTNVNTDQLGYTNAAVDLHTDQPFIEHPPRLQLLQSIRAAEAGGSNYVVDAWAATRYLRSVDARAYHLLTTKAVRFHRKQKAFESLVVAPILQVDAAGELVRVRYSYFTMDPFDFGFAEMEEWYRAYDKFARVVRNPDFQYKFDLQPGDFLLYDNHRMLHARTAFRGGRWVRGIYFDR